MTLNKQTGFTLVELAIVMTIIGLLIGGILKGQELLENARVTSTLAQVKSYDASVTAFRDIYDALPGDLRDAALRLPSCGGGCSPLDLNSGDGAVGAAAWDYATTQSATILHTGKQTAQAPETTLFWIHMAKANLISGVTESALTAATPAAWGTTHPAAKIGGGWVVGSGSGTTTPAIPTGVNSTGLSGNQLALVTLPADTVSGVVAGSKVLTPGRAAQMDRKMDDGVPTTGGIRSFGTVASCAGAAAPFAYLESTTTKDCGILVKIQS